MSSNAEGLQRHIVAGATCDASQQAVGVHGVTSSMTSGGCQRGDIRPCPCGSWPSDIRHRLGHLCNTQSFWTTGSWREKGDIYTSLDHCQPLISYLRMSSLLHLFPGEWSSWEDSVLLWWWRRRWRHMWIHRTHWCSRKCHWMSRWAGERDPWRSQCS